MTARKISFLLSRRQMFLRLLIVAIATIIICQGGDATVKMQNESFEYKLRQELTNTSYDRFVRPVLPPLTIVNVLFSFKLLSLINVDNKKQMVTSKLLIKQSWHNPFLTWNQDDFGGIDHVRMRKDEIWVPDITLHNSANNPSLQTSYLHENWVTVFSNGTNVWVSVAIYDSECEIKVNNFPFDVQRCSLDFASESYDADTLDIHLLPGDKTNTKEEEEENYKQISNGEWDIINITSRRHKEISVCCSAPFVHIKLTLDLKRIATFYILYVLCPCTVLSLLVFFSFIIPPESGERIGFCSSLLLSLSVYLLLLSDLLPRNSRNVSLLGVLFVLIFLVGALALVSTLLVLKVYHAKSEIPTLIKLLFLCECGSNKEKINRRNNKLKPLQSTLKEEDPSLFITSEVNIGAELDMQPITENQKREEQKQEIENQINYNAEENQKSWLKVARKLDRLFFWIFFIILLLSLTAVMGIAEYLNNL